MITYRLWQSLVPSIVYTYVRYALILLEVKVEVCVCCAIQEETVTVPEFVKVGGTELSEVVEGWRLVDVATAGVVLVGSFTDAEVEAIVFVNEVIFFDFFASKASRVFFLSFLFWAPDFIVHNIAYIRGSLLLTSFNSTDQKE